MKSVSEGQSLYRKIAALLTDRVRAGAFGARLPTLQQLAEEYDVGMVTMRRAIGILQAEGVVTATRGRGIEPTRLRRGRTHTLGLVVGGVQGPLGRRLQEGVAEACQEHGQAMLTECYRAEAERQDKLVRSLVEERQVDGLILWPSEQGAGSTTIIDYLQQEAVPFVLVPEPDFPRSANCHTVSNADSGAAADVMMHLIGRGARRIRFACEAPPAEANYARHRYERYMHSMTVAGLPVESPLVCQDETEWIPQLQECDAVFCATDRLACRVLCGCLATGVKVPGDLLVAGYDNTEAAGLMDLTSVEQHFDRIGKEAVLILLDDIEGRTSGPVHHTVTAELITRASTGLPVT